MKRILLTGFEPVAGVTLNPSWEVARRFRGALMGDGSRVIGAQLPWVFGRALHMLLKQMDSFRPQTVVALGQADGSTEIWLERAAINLDDTRLADNMSQQPVDVSVISGGAAGYFSSLPIKAIAVALRVARIPVAVSQNAGAYVCKYVFYGLMHEASRRDSLTRAGFIHLPYLPAQTARRPRPPSMSLETLLSALRVALLVAQTARGDAAISEGA